MDYYGNEYSKTPVLEVTNLVKTYKHAKVKGKTGRLNAVQGISFCAYEGEILGLLGPNGAGKSTTIKMITGLATPTSGQVKICGYDVIKQPEKAKACIGGVIESPDLYVNLNAEENLKLFASLRTKEELIDPLNKDAEAPLTLKELVAKRIESVLKLVGLYDRRYDLVRKYSLGMKQRLGIAQAIMEYPKLLILDEPANGLDPAGIRGVRMLLKELAEKYHMAIIVSSHQLAEMQVLCERVIIIDDGKIIAERNLSDKDVDAGGMAKIHVKIDRPEEAAEFLRKRFACNVDIQADGIVAHTNVDVADVTKELIMSGFNIFGVDTVMVKLEDIFITATEKENK